MSDHQRNASKRFDRTVWTERLVPVVLGILFLILIAVFIIVGLAAVGLI